MAKNAMDCLYRRVMLYNRATDASCPNSRIRERAFITADGAEDNMVRVARPADGSVRRRSIRAQPEPEPDASHT